ncbi:hypothetical protein [Petrachloros mirabilis]
MRTTWRRMRVWNACAGVCAGLLFWVGCTPSPLSNGTFKQLPTSETPLIVWGHQPAVVNPAVLWFRAQGVPVIESSVVREYLLKHADHETVMFDESAVLEAARAMHASQVAFVSQAGDLRAPAVFVRGVDVSTGEVVWIGTSRYSRFASDPVPHTLGLLTCHALEAVRKTEAKSAEERCRM